VTIESSIFDTLKTLVAESSVYPDNAPVGTKPPYITFQQVGGPGINFLDGTQPDKGLPRFQITVWEETRIKAKALSKQAETALRAVTALQTTVEGEPVSQHDEETGLYGSRQDFSFVG
jgi:hypothetical protein